MSDAAAFLEGLRAQESKYRAVAACADDQARAMERADLDALLAVIGRQSAALAEVEALERRIAPLRARWTELKATADAATVRAVEETLARTRELLQSMIGGAPAPSRAAAAWSARRAYGA